VCSSIGAGETAYRPRCAPAPGIVVSGGLVDGPDEMLGRKICQALESLQRQSAAFPQQVCC
jgi:hypothetical protein